MLFSHVILRETFRRRATEESQTKCGLRKCCQKIFRCAQDDSNTGQLYSLSL